MGNKIAIMGVGAVGGYAGAHMAQAGEDVLLIPFAINLDQTNSAGELLQLLVPAPHRHANDG